MSDIAKQIVLEVAVEAGISRKKIMSRDRTEPVSHARARAMARIRFELGWSLSRIGRFFDRDHTTVLYHIIEDGKRRFPE